MKVLQDTLDHARKYGKDNGHDKMYVTDKEEVFTSFNLAMNSVGQNQKRVAVVNIEPEVAEVIPEATAAEAGGPVQEAVGALADTPPATNSTGKEKAGASTSGNADQESEGGQSDNKGGEGTTGPATSAPAGSKKGEGMKA